MESPEAVWDTSDQGRAKPAGVSGWKIFDREGVEASGIEGDPAEAISTCDNGFEA